MHQDAVLAVRFGLLQRRTYVGGVGYRLAADVENDVTGLQAMLGRGTFRIDSRHHYALLAGAILALNDSEIAAALDRWRAAQTASVAETPTIDSQS